MAACLLLLGGCAQPEGLALRRWQAVAPSPLARERPVQALSPGQLEWAESLLLKDGFVPMAEERFAAPPDCPAAPLCRFAADRVLVELGAERPWLVHLTGRTGVLDVIDAGTEVVVVQITN